MKNTRVVLSNIPRAIGLVILIVALGFIGLAMVSQNKDYSLFGYHEYVVLTGSMEPELPVQSVIITQEIAPEDIHIGDVITFEQKNGRIVTHRVQNVMQNYQNSGRIAFKTKGDANMQVDAEVVIADNVRGVVRMHIAELGYVFTYISQNILLVFIIYALFAGSLILYSRSMKEKRATAINNAIIKQNIPPSN